MTIYCVGRNYVKHAHELGNEVPELPLIFLKAESSLRSLQQGAVAFAEEIFHHEAELVLHIGEDLELGQRFELRHIDAISLGIDLTRRNVQSELKAKGLPWTTAKSFAGSALLGKKHPFLPHLQGSNLTFELLINGNLRQRGETQNMIFSFEVIGNYINSFSPLKKGDLIYTGTPEGVGEMRVGDQFAMKFLETEMELGIL